MPPEYKEIFDFIWKAVLAVGGIGGVVVMILKVGFSMYQKKAEELEALQETMAKGKEDTNKREINLIVDKLQQFEKKINELMLDAASFKTVNLKLDIAAKAIEKTNKDLETHGRVFMQSTKEITVSLTEHATNLKVMEKGLDATKVDIKDAEKALQLAELRYKEAYDKIVNAEKGNEIIKGQLLKAARLLKDAKDEYERVKSHLIQIGKDVYMLKTPPKDSK